MRVLHIKIGSLVSLTLIFPEIAMFYWCFSVCFYFSIFGGVSCASLLEHKWLQKLHQTIPRYVCSIKLHWMFINVHPQSVGSGHEVNVWIFPRNNNPVAVGLLSVTNDTAAKTWLAKINRWVQWVQMFPLSAQWGLKRMIDILLTTFSNIFH